MIWETVLLGEILHERSESPSVSDILSENIRIVSKISFARGEIELRQDGKSKTDLILIYPGDLVLSGINATKGAIALYGENESSVIAATIHYSSYIPLKERVITKFLWWYLRSDAFRKIVQEHVPGGIKSELRPKKFLSIPIKLPSVMEQQRLVAFLENISIKAKNAQQGRIEIKLQMNGLMESIIQEVMSKLEITGKFGDVLLMKPRAGPSFLTDINWEGTRVLMPSAVSGFGVNLGKVEYGMGNEKISEKDLLEPGDILIARGNKREQVGNAGVVPNITKGWVCANLLMRMKVDLGLIDQHFVIYWLRSPYMRRHVKDRMNGTNPNIQKINQQVILNFPFPTKTPLEVQRRLVAYLDDLQAQVSQLRLRQSETQQQLDALMPSILDKAFNGEL